MEKFTTVDDYIAGQSPDVQWALNKIREVIQKAAPGALEGIFYGMPGYKFNGKPLVYFAANKNHLGFYATPSANEAYKKELTGFKMGKGSIQFPFDQKIPFPLIAKMVGFKLNEISRLKKAKGSSG